MEDLALITEIINKGCKIMIQATRNTGRLGCIWGGWGGYWILPAVDLRRENTEARGGEGGEVAGGNKRIVPEQKR